MLDRAIETWNRLGLDLGLGYLYQRCDEPDSADLHIRWSDPQLPRDKAAATWWSAGESQRRVLGLSMDGKFAIPEGNQAQILTHELGHVLGLGESYQPGDMMYYIMERRHLRLDQVQLSMRDKLALRWLYQQQNFIPIRGRRD
jgi:predicted Zn-dependent protease